jgi:hypothetical protein
MTPNIEPQYFKKLLCFFSSPWKWFKNTTRRWLTMKETWLEGVPKSF